MRILISGATGLVGSSLADALRTGGHEVGVLSRRDPTTGAAGGAPARVAWDPERGPDPADLADWDTVVHLAGRSVATLWTDAARRQIRDSRVCGTAGIAEAVARARGAGAGPSALICASAVGYYGERGDEVLNESAEPGAGFLAGVCRAWEDAAEPARAAGVRTAHLRIGLVLTPVGGVLQKMLTPFRLGLGGNLGRGRQWMSWITHPDVVRALEFLALDADAEGAFNGTAPEPVRNADFTRTLGRVLGRPAVLPVPAFLLNMLPGGQGREMLLSSQRAIPARLTERGFTFRNPELEDALRALLT